MFRTTLAHDFLNENFEVGLFCYIITLWKFHP